MADFLSGRLWYQASSLSVLGRITKEEDFMTGYSPWAQFVTQESRTTTNSSKRIRAQRVANCNKPRMVNGSRHRYNPHPQMQQLNRQANTVVFR
ncbi:unnamed protein product [Dovyalis caffra]|uniref:Uncharacterized protein n=1 Tax=Dovyalis caffra TaxID=77055 RepID=A0AAV1RBK2_9ROSI|nr:unnamed protein product [Dovyalis caffra]